MCIKLSWNSTLKLSDQSPGPSLGLGRRGDRLGPTPEGGPTPNTSAVQRLVWLVQSFAALVRSSLSVKNSGPSSGRDTETSSQCLNRGKKSHGPPASVIRCCVRQRSLRRTRILPYLIKIQKWSWSKELANLLAFAACCACCGRLIC